MTRILLIGKSGQVGGALENLLAGQFDVIACDRARCDLSQPDQLRAAIGESAREPRHVRTVHRHGYAFQDAASDGVPAGSPVSYWLVTEKGDLPLRSGENIVGRDPTARVWLDSPSVSRRHARIVVATDRVTLEDLGSKNGTFAADVRVTTEVPLGDGHALRFGSVAVVFRAWAADPTRTEGGGC